MTSALFTRRQLHALRRIGDLLIPAHAPFPAFSACGALDQVDIIMRPAHPRDLADFKLALNVLSFLPDAVLMFILRCGMNAHGKNHLLAVPFRQLDIGLRGIIFSLYYANQHRDDNPIFDIIGYHVHCEPDEPHHKENLS
ncbi:MAG: hypothetical protein Q4G42_01405 [Neisseria sp.]|nr:hypothetical protein [Neisseria sp.]